MNKNIFYAIVGLMLSSALFSSCNEKHKGGRTDTYSSGAIKFASDESFGSIIDEEKQIFESIYPSAKVNPIYTNEVDGINMLLHNKVCLVITSRNLTKAEYANFEARQFQPRAIPIAYDGFALIVNKSNVDTCITVDNIRKILSGQANKWKQINSKSKLGDIEVVFSNGKSSTVRYAVDSILHGKPINSPNIFATNKTSEVIEYVQKTPNAIGIIGSNWLNEKGDSTNVTFNKKIRVMSVSRMAKATPYNSWKPYQAYLYNGNYPLIRTIYALLNDPINGLPWGFAHFMESPKGQMIIFKSGMLPVQGNITIRDVNVNE
jgi:phosphate transport system substrate-binding protein